MVIKSIETALKNMDRRYYKLSRTLYSGSKIYQCLPGEKYLERPFAYEFYHQFRKLIDEGRISFGVSVIQAEVDKGYQRLASLDKVPDFILHAPNTTKNVAVIEFKLVSNNRKRLVDDLEKLVLFSRDAGYTLAVEVVIGNSRELKETWKKLDELKTGEGVEISVIAYDVDERNIERRTILFKPTSVDGR